MPEILIRCPVTGKDVPTGIALPSAVFQSATIDPVPVHCPHCGLEHPWDQQDAYQRVPPEREPPVSGPAR